MTDNEIVIAQVNESQIPSIIQGQFSQLEAVRSKVSHATEMAEKAQDKAKYAGSKGAGLFQKKEAIEALQDAASDLAGAQVAQAEAQKVSFEYQEKLGEVTKYLFRLGVINIAMNRSVVRELEMKLRGASAEELDEFAKQELLGVLRQLKAQEDIMKKQSELSAQVKDHDSLIGEGIAKDEEQDSELSRQASKDAEHDRLFVAAATRDKKQDEELARQAEKDVEHDQLLAAAAERDQKQDSELERQASKDAEHDCLLAKIAEINRSQDEALEQQAQLATQRAQMIEDLQAQGKAQDNQIAELIADKAKQAEQIKAILTVNEDQAKEIAGLKEKCASLETQLQSECTSLQTQQSDSTSSLNTLIEAKASKTIGIVSILIGSAALIIAIIQFFI